MSDSAEVARTTSTIITNDYSDNNHMRQRKFRQNHNDLFGANETNWRKKLSSTNYQHSIDKNHQALPGQIQYTAKHFTSTNWINIRRNNLKRANRHSVPISTTYSDTEHSLTNLDVQFAWNSRIYFSVSPKIYSR